MFPLFSNPLRVEVIDPLWVVVRFVIGTDPQVPLMVTLSRLGFLLFGHCGHPSFQPCLPFSSFSHIQPPRDFYDRFDVLCDAFSRWQLPEALYTCFVVLFGKDSPSFFCFFSSHSKGFSFSFSFSSQWTRPFSQSFLDSVCMVPTSRPPRPTC